MTTGQVRTLLKRVYAEGREAFQKEWLGWLEAKTGPLHVVYTPNPEQIVQATRLPQFAEALQNADVLLPDGHGLVWASQWWRMVARVLPGSRPPERILEVIPGVTIAGWWLKQTVRRKRRTLLLGALGDTAAQVAKYRDPSGRWIQGRVGYANVRYATREEEQAVQAFITEWQPEVVLVAFGAPRQEYWVEAHRRFLRSAGVRIVMVCGGALTTLSGQTPRAPEWMQRMGLEWLHRLYLEPWRWRRQRRILLFAYWALTKRSWWCRSK